jgi:hypothetical protein
MQPIMCVLAILLAISMVPEPYSEKPVEKVTMMEIQKMEEQETVKPEEDDYSGNDFSIYWSVVDLSRM